MLFSLFFARVIISRLVFHLLFSLFAYAIHRFPYLWASSCVLTANGVRRGLRIINANYTWATGTLPVTRRYTGWKPPCTRAHHVVSRCSCMLMCRSDYRPIQLIPPSDWLLSAARKERLVLARIFRPSSPSPSPIAPRFVSSASRSRAVSCILKPRRATALNGRGAYNLWIIILYYNMCRPRFSLSLFLPLSLSFSPHAGSRYARLVFFELLRGEKHLVGNSEIKSIVNGVGFSLLLPFRGMIYRNKRAIARDVV